MKARGLSTALALVISLGIPHLAWAHGGEDEAMAGSEEQEVMALAKQPARILAQQAIAELKVRGDKDEAAVRLDAALASKDKSDIDVKLLREGTEKLDAGHPDAAIPLLDEALSRPVGSESGASLHAAGREFQPGTGAQEVVGILAGAALLALGLGALVLSRRRGQPEPRA